MFTTLDHWKECTCNVQPLKIPKKKKEKKKKALMRIKRIWVYRLILQSPEKLGESSPYWRHTLPFLSLFNLLHLQLKFNQWSSFSQFPKQQNHYFIHILHVQKLHLSRWMNNNISYPQFRHFNILAWLTLLTTCKGRRNISV